MIKEDAIEILSDMRAEYNIFSDDEEEATRYHALSWAIQALNEQQRTGRWTIEDCHAATYKYCCSNCKAHHRALYDFCPSCGARMEDRNE